MNEEIVDSLTTRISSLEISLSQVSHTSTQSIMKQMVGLRNELDSVYKETGEFVTLTNLVEKLGDRSENEIIDLKTEDITIDLNSKHELIDLKISPLEKETLILLKHPAILQAYNNLIQLSNMDLSLLTNYTSSIQDKFHDLDRDRRVVLQHEDELKELTRVFHQVVVKNMLVFERYVGIVLRENEFWLETEKRISLLERRHLQALNKEKERAKY
jgi:hypothetical protein